MKTRNKKRKGGRASLKYLIDRFMPRNRTVSKASGLAFKIRDTCKKKWWRPLNKEEACNAERAVPNLFQRLNALKKFNVSDQFFLLKNALSIEHFYLLDAKLIQDIQTILGENLPLLLKAVFGEIVFDPSKVIVALMKNDMDFFVNRVVNSSVDSTTKLSVLTRLYPDLTEDFDTLPLNDFTKRAISGVIHENLHRNYQDPLPEQPILRPSVNEWSAVEKGPAAQEPFRPSVDEWSAVEKEPAAHTGENYFEREAAPDHPVRKMAIDVQDAALGLQKTVFEVEMIVFATKKKLSPDFEFLSDFEFLNSAFNADLTKIRLKTEVLRQMLEHLYPLIYVYTPYYKEQIALFKKLTTNGHLQIQFMNNCITAYLDDPSNKSLFMSFIPNIYLSIPMFQRYISYMFPEIAQFNELGILLKKNQFLFADRKYISNILRQLIQKVLEHRANSTPKKDAIGFLYGKFIEAILSKLK